MSLLIETAKLHDTLQRRFRCDGSKIDPVARWEIRSLMDRINDSDFKCISADMETNLIVLENRYALMVLRTLLDKKEWDRCIDCILIGDGWTFKSKYKQFLALNFDLSYGDILLEDIKGGCSKAVDSFVEWINEIKVNIKYDLSIEQNMFSKPTDYKSAFHMTLIDNVKLAIIAERIKKYEEEFNSLMKGLPLLLN